MLADENGSVAVLIRGHAERKGEALSFDQIHLWQLRDGKATSFQSYQDGYAEDDFWSL